MPSTPIDIFVEKQLRLIELEREHEAEESRQLRNTLSAKDLEKRGLCLLHLKIDDTSVGIGGRVHLRLIPEKHQHLPSHRFQPGDLASIETHSDKQEKPIQGIVYRIYRDSLVLSLDEEPNFNSNKRFRLDRLTDDVTYRRLKDGLHKLKSFKKGRAQRLRECLMGIREIEPPSSKESLSLSQLNDSQNLAVERALSAPVVSLIHGPPGTGKTTTLIETIVQLAQSGKKILACAASNIAVDNLVERLSERDVPIVRTGHPARMLPSVLDHSLDSQIEKDSERKAIKQVQRELQGVQRRLSRTHNYQRRKEMKFEARALREEVKFLERVVMDKILDRSQVVLTTLVGAATSMFETREFDVVVIDEAAQALESACWIPLLKAEKAILAGDHLQLPPTILSRKAAKDGLEITLFDRIANEQSEPIVNLLTTQYRMNERIMEFSSEELYDGRLEAHTSVSQHRLSDLKKVQSGNETEHSLLLIDTAGCDHEETHHEDSGSKANPGEVEIVAQQVERLLDSGLQARELAVITPYNAQVNLLRKRLSGVAQLEVDTVDGFQGREKEAIILSLVRSNEKGEVGFLADTRRLNVAITRARRQLTVIGDTATVTRNDFISRLIDHIQEKGEYRSAWEYQ